MEQTRKDTKKSFLLCYTFAVLLLLAYGIILLTGLHYTGSSDTYSLYYLDHQLKYFVRDAEFKQTYRPGNRISLTSSSGQYRCLGSGWSEPEAPATWAVGMQSDFLLWVEEPAGEAVMTLEIQQAVDGVPNSLYVNDQYAGPISIIDNTAQVPLDGSLLHPGANVFSIRRETMPRRYCEINTQSTDDRLLNVYVNAVCLTFPSAQ